MIFLKKSLRLTPTLTLLMEWHRDERFGIPRSIPLKQEGRRVAPSALPPFPSLLRLIPHIQTTHQDCGE